MFYFLRLNFLFRIILFSVLSKAFAAHPAYASEEIPYLTRIIINGDSVLLIPTTTKERDKFFRQNFMLEYGNNNITFELTPADTFEYQYFLGGFDGEWTPWKQSNCKEYTNLPAGHYTFQARYRGPDNKVGQLRCFPYGISPDWQ
jgi:hypothetical protein